MTASLQLRLQHANQLLREGKYDEAVEKYDSIAQDRPRNFWIRLNAVMACIRAGRLNDAHVRIGKIDNSSQLGQQVLVHMKEYLESCRNQQPTSSLQVNSPVDYWSASINGLAVAPHRKISVSKKFPSGFNFELELPRHVGVNNDYRFLTDVANRRRALRTLARQKVLVVCFINSQIEFDAVAISLNLQSCDSGTIELLVISLSEHPINVESVRSTVTIRKLDRSKPLAQFNENLIMTNADVLVFLPSSAELKIYTLEQMLHYYSFTTLAVFAFPSIAEVESSPTFMRQFDISGDVKWHAELYPFRKLSFGNMVIGRTAFREAGGFSTEIMDGDLAFRELGYRLYLQGSYFVPAPVPFSPIRSPITGREKFEDYCAANWYRKTDGVYKTPKVSIYVPSYNNGKYIVQAINSILDQDFVDLEVCVCDDGSTDDSLTRLRAEFGTNSRVKIIAAENGGIGSASNKAVSIARGMYVGQLDSDDLLKPGAVRTMVDYLDQHREIVCVYSSCERIDAEGNYIQDEYNFPVYSREKMLTTSIAHHFRMFRRNIWARTDGFREDILNAVDYDMFLKLSELGQFHHIEQFMYQRRWHGGNTSHVNEGTQSKNTSVVQNWSLRRQGLHNMWHAIAEDPAQPRKITFKRRAEATRIFFWPDYSGANPYQRLLYKDLTDGFDVLAGDVYSALKAINDNRGAGPVIFHLHWLNQILVGSTEAEQTTKVDEFLKAVRTFKKKGGRLVWTIHNAISHEAQFASLERKLMESLCQLSDRIHFHCHGSIDELGPAVKIPQDKVFIVPHGHYADFYPNYVSKSDARKIMGIPLGAFVIAFTGQVRSYKGLDMLVEGFNTLPDEDAYLLIGGKAESADLAKLLEGIRPAIRHRVIFTNRFLDDNSLQLFYRAADVAVYPYTRILTSGSALLALSFGVPAILPKIAMTKELYSAEFSDLLFEGGSQEALNAAILAVLKKKEQGLLSRISSSLQARAKSYSWQGVAALFI